jgi:hypothetical protein
MCSDGARRDRLSQYETDTEKIYKVLIWDGRYGMVTRNATQYWRRTTAFARALLFKGREMTKMPQSALIFRAKVCGWTRNMEQTMQWLLYSFVHVVTAGVPTGDD